VVTAYPYLLGLIALERGVELWISRRNAQRALARGAVELGQRHFRFMQLLHGSFLLGAGLEVALLDRPFIPALAVMMGAVMVASQVLRYWAIASLGDRWNVRVIVTPGDRAVTRGPYAYFKHPNYLAVVLEGLAIPLFHSAWLTAAIFTVLNAALLWVRIRCEEQALATHTDYRKAFAR
jgi:methyltransferase